MGKINVLSSEIYNKIAAGEVAERPASVVKELVENSIDAGATAISVAVENGGLLSIVVADNGCGMDKEDAKKAFLPHATSKVKTENDLFSIESLGFRGEALASIAAVSKVEMTTRVADNDAGVKVYSEDGKITVSECGGAKGTKITVNNLFYNTPARFKFLRKPRSEASEITNLVSRFILANPDISFSYTIDGEVIFENTGKGLEHAIFTVYGKDTLENLVAVNHTHKDIRVTGYVGRPDFIKANSTYQTQIVNGRWVTSPKISAAGSAVYREYLMPRTYPFCVLDITLPHDKVDVNVHPNKSDVRFSEGDEVFSAVFGAIKRALEKLRADESKDFVSRIEEREKSAAITENQKQMTLTWQQPVVNMGYAVTLRENDNAVKRFYETTEMTPLAAPSASDGNEFYETAKTPLATPNANVGIVLNIITSEEAKKASETVKIIGQLFKNYIIIEYSDKFCIIDQHAAHERLLFDKYEKQLSENSVYGQNLLVPYTLTVNSAEYAFLNERLALFNEAGFDIAPFGKLSFVVGCVPFVLSDIDFETFFKEILRGANSGGEAKPMDAFRHYLMQKACKAAVREGDALAIEEIKALLGAISKEMPELYCPHGRPIIREFKKAEVEKWFKRI